MMKVSIEISLRKLSYAKKSPEIPREQRKNREIHTKKIPKKTY